MLFDNAGRLECPESFFEKISLHVPVSVDEFGKCRLIVNGKSVDFWPDVDKLFRRLDGIPAEVVEMEGKRFVLFDEKKSATIFKDDKGWPKLIHKGDYSAEINIGLIMRYIMATFAHPKKRVRITINDLDLTIELVEQVRKKAKKK